MNPEYTKLEERRFSEDFATDFTHFITSNRNSAFFDKTWSSKEHRQRISRLLADHPVSFHEFESSTLNLKEMRARLVGNLEFLPEESDFDEICHVMSATGKPGLIMIYRCSELEADSVDFLCKLNTFLKTRKSKWKIVYFGEIEGVYPLHLERLAPDYIYTSLPIAKRPSWFYINRTMFSLLCILVILCLYAAPYYMSVAQKYYIEFSSDKSVVVQGAINTQAMLSSNRKSEKQWLKQDLGAWESRVAEFNAAMSEFDRDIRTHVSERELSTPGSKSEAKHTKRLSEQLIQATKIGDIEFVSLNISSGLDIDSLSAKRETMLILATAYQQKDLVFWLLSQSANVGLSDNDNRSALYYAAVNGNIEIARKLIAYDASPTQVSRLNKSPLMAAVHNNYFDLSSLLIDSNSDVNQQDHSGWSALYFAVWNGNVEMASLLLRNGANPQLKDSDGYTAVDIATAKNNADILGLF
jgi:hypothetical protein